MNKEKPAPVPQAQAFLNERMNDWMQETSAVQLCNRNYRLRVHRGGISSFRPGKAYFSGEDTEFILPGQIFGGFLLRYKKGKESGSIQVDAATACEVGACSAGISQQCITLQPQASAKNILGIQSRYSLQADVLHHRLCLQNKSEESVTIEDLGFLFPGNTEFQWGTSAGDKVLGHHFIAGHGSHLTFIRCDGQGPFLLVLPQGDTSFEYFEEYRQAGQEETDGAGAGTYIAYIHSAHARSAAVKAGAVMRTPESRKTLAPGETAEYTFLYTLAKDYADAKKQFVKHGLIDVEVAPGLTVPQDTPVHLSLSACWPELSLSLPKGSGILQETREGQRRNYILTFSQCGENQLRIHYDGSKKYMNVDFFVTQPVEILLKKRRDFIKKTQIMDETQWYYGLFGEWNNETGALLSPGNYDKIKGWRIYEVSCDDPGLGKPAFLSGVLAEHPERSAVQALDRYVEHFVWGGLQRTDAEAYPYGIYGIPDWKQNRESEDTGLGGKLHIWRIYDYPHIALMYFNLYRIAKSYAGMPLSHGADTYLLRAYETAVAMFTIPLELDGWSAFQTGLYNELVIEDILAALEQEKLVFQAARLGRLWDRKAAYFTLENRDIFGSEYPFDTTGFESTHALAKHSLRKAEMVEKSSYHNPQITVEKAWDFMENQMRCNIACRGTLEPAYYWYGSDYRGNNWKYTLSYMSQMGGWAILDYALYYAQEPFALLRLAYGSILSAWALMNAGDARDNYGYWFPGAVHDGAAGGGFEPLPLGETWLDQPHHGGPWYYSCEIDLGFCGYLRAAATVLAEDPIFGQICYGGMLLRQGTQIIIKPTDGVNRRFHYIGSGRRLHVLLEQGCLTEITLNLEKGECIVEADLSALALPEVLLTVQIGETVTTYSLSPSDSKTWKIPLTKIMGGL